MRRGESRRRSSRRVPLRDDRRRRLRAPTIRAAQRARPCQLTVPQLRADGRRSRRDGVGGSWASASRRPDEPCDRSATKPAHGGRLRIVKTEGHAACRHRRSHNPRPGGPTSAAARLPGDGHTAPPATGRRVSSADPRRQKPTVTGTTPRLHDGEQRLTALWEHGLDDAAAEPKTADDAIAALFSSSPDGEAHTSPRETTGRTRRAAPDPGSQRAQARSRRRRSHLPHRLFGAGAAVAAAVALLVLAPDWFGEHPDSVATKAHPQASHTAAAAGGRSAQPERKVRDGHTVRGHHRRPATQQAPEAARPRRRLTRAAQRDRDPPAPPPSRSATLRPLAEPAPPHAREVPSAAATSSACDEFPPC